MSTRSRLSRGGSQKVRVTLGGFAMEMTDDGRELGEGGDAASPDPQSTVRSIAELLEHEEELAAEDVAPHILGNGLVVDGGARDDEEEDIEEQARRMGVDAGEISMISRATSRTSSLKRTLSQASSLKPRVSEVPLKVSVALLFLVIVVGVPLIFHFYRIQLHLLEIGAAIKFNEITRHMDVERADGMMLMVGDLGLEIPSDVKFLDCSADNTRTSHLCLTWKKHAQMWIDYSSHGNVKCYKIAWWGHQFDTVLKDCYDLGGAHWFGGGFLTPEQRWVLDDVTLNETLYVTGNMEEPSHLGPVIGRYWLNSNGIAIFAPSDRPLFVSINEEEDGNRKQDGDRKRRFCLVSHNLDEFGLQKVKETPEMNYTLCVSDDVTAVHRYALNRTAHVHNYTAVAPPDEDLFRKTVWSTNQLTAVTQASLIGYSNNITVNDYSHGFLILNSQWEKYLGDLTFNPRLFPDVNETLKTLKSNFKLTLAVTPYVDTRSEIFNHLIEEASVFVPDVGGTVPGLTRYQRDGGTGVTAGVLNTTSDHFVERLKTLRDRFGIDSVLLNSGVVTGLPYGADHGATATHNVNTFTQAYVSKARGVFSTLFTESASQAQVSLPVIAMQPLPPTWEGLRSVVPKILTLGLLGYPYVLPDAVGGTLHSARPSKDLFTRWLQLNAFLPIMHLSILPHSYDTATADLARKWIRFHVTEITPRVMRTVRDAASPIEPIVRPVWWIAPQDNQTFTLDDQFLLGDGLLVAPVLCEAGSRDIYLPEGAWRDALSNVTRTGPQWLRDYNVTMDQVPHFFWQSQ